MVGARGESRIRAAHSDPALVGRMVYQADTLRPVRTIEPRVFDSVEAWVLLPIRIAIGVARTLPCQRSSFLCSR